MCVRSECRYLPCFMFRFREGGHKKSQVGHQWRQFEVNEKPLWIETGLALAATFWGITLTTPTYDRSPAP